MKKVTLPGHRTIGSDPDPELDIDALSRAAAADDNSPVVVTSRYLRQVERELRAARALRAEAARAIGMQLFINSITAGHADKGSIQ